MNDKSIFPPADLGQAIHRRTLEACGTERQVAVRRAEEAVWAQAENMRQEALEKAARKASLDHEKAVKKLVKAHEKAIKVHFQDFLISTLSGYMDSISFAGQQGYLNTFVGNMIKYIN